MQGDAESCFGQSNTVPRRRVKEIDVVLVRRQQCLHGLFVGDFDVQVTERGTAHAQHGDVHVGIDRSGGGVFGGDGGRLGTLGGLPGTFD